MNQLTIDYKQLFASPQGMRVLEDLSSFCCERRTCYMQGDHCHTIYNEGARAVILRIRLKIDEEDEEDKTTKTIS